MRIDSRIRRLSLGNPGDMKPVGEGVSKIRIDYGPGDRVYFVQRGEAEGGGLAVEDGPGVLRAAGGGPGRPSGRRRQGQCLGA